MIRSAKLVLKKYEIRIKSLIAVQITKLPEIQVLPAVAYTSAADLQPRYPFESPL
jgi:hypothetical protein